MKRNEKILKLDTKEIKIVTGGFAHQADAAVMASCGGTVVMATVVAQDLQRDIGYFPLTVEYQERLYAGGRIKGSRWVKREGRPSDDEILTARLIDRSIRPLFPKDYKKEVQVIITVLSVDLENPPDVIAGLATSAALSLSPIPWQGPVGMVRVGSKDKKLLINPVDEEIASSDLDLIVSSTKDAVVMIESGANEVSEEQMIKSIEKAHEENQKLVKFIAEVVKEYGKEKEKIEKKTINKDLYKKVKDLFEKQADEAIKGMANKDMSYADFDQMKAGIADSFEEDEKEAVYSVIEEVFSQKVRKMLLSGKRPDGRKMDELRKLSAEVSVLPRTHGSAIFNRGLTQALTIATLGAPSLEQLIESAEGEESKRYIHHYSMPPYSVGEAGRVGSPKRREIGHGALAERALFPVIPSKMEFPYTIRLVTEVLSSNGSTSMASTCGSTLALMDAGVPIKSPVAGIAMGLVIENEKEFGILTDIVGMEDGNGDMDFKVAGTKDGITALQLDVKTLKLTLPILKKALEAGKKARLEILDVMQKAIETPREKVSEYAPTIKRIEIDKEKIGELIGPGGKTIKAIIATTGADVDVDDEGVVFVSSTDEKQVDEAIKQVQAIVKDPEVGEIYEGEVKKLLSFGAFVEILPGKEGMVHVSDISTEFVKDPGDVLEVGQIVKVKVKEIDDLGRVNLTMLLDEKAQKQKSRSGGGNGGRHSRSQRRSGGRSDKRRSGRDRGGRRNHTKSKRSSGPHFPTSRLMNDNKNY